MNFLESERIKRLLIGSVEDTSRVGRELQFSVCKDKEGKIFPTELIHGDRHQFRRDYKRCPLGSKEIASIHTHSPMYLAGKGALSSQARLSNIDIVAAHKHKKTECVAQKIKNTNEVVVKCLTPKMRRIMLEDLYRGNPKVEKNTENDEKLLNFWGRKMMFSEEKSKRYLKEKRFNLENYF